MATLILQQPQQVPSPAQDCETLRKAFQGCKTDEKAVIKVLGHRNATQIKIIRDTYQELYNQSLIDSLNSNLSGDFGRAVMLWACEPKERDARLVHKALNSKQIGINEPGVVIAEIYYTTSRDDWWDIRHCYRSLFNSGISIDTQTNLPESIALTLFRFTAGYRVSGTKVDLNEVNDDVIELKSAIESKEVNQFDVGMIFGCGSYAQVKAIFEAYHQKYGTLFSEDIKDCCGDDMSESLLKIMIRCIVSPEKHFAEVIRAALSCTEGIDHDSLTRAIVRRAEIDMMKLESERSIFGDE